MSRDYRNGEVVCNCPSYKFPHRQFGGRCTLQRWVDRFFEPTKSDCSGCLCCSECECEVVNQIETPYTCPALRDYIRFEGITLYGAARHVQRRAIK